MNPFCRCTRDRECMFHQWELGWLAVIGVTILCVAATGVRIMAGD